MSLVHVLLALTTAVTVPLAGVVTGPVGTPVVAVLGGLAALGALLPAGPLAAAATAPWVLLAVLGATTAASRWWRAPSWHAALAAVAPAFLAVGALWLTADRLGAAPFGFGPPFVALTAVHFHLAGAVLAAFCATALVAVPERAGPRVAATLVAGGPPIVAVGFVWSGVLQIAGAVVVTAGLWSLSWVAVRDVAPRVDRTTRRCLTVAAASAVVPMVLAVQWAVGHVAGTPALSIAAMGRTHGVLNAVGVGLVGAVGWRRVARGATVASGRQEPR